MSEQAVDIVGTVTMARISSPRLAIRLDDGQELEMEFEPDDEATVTTALKEHQHARLRLRGLAQVSPSGRVVRILHVSDLHLVPAEGQPEPRPDQPSWERISRIVGDVPGQKRERIPEDGSHEHDHYIYGTPKQPS
jgi:hypothetical protein